jgi:hypothetical protein
VITTSGTCSTLAWGNAVRFSKARAATGQAWIERRSGADRPFAGAAMANRKLLLAVEPEELIVVHHIALPLQKDMNAPVAESPAFMGNRLHPLPKIAFVGAR